MVSKPSPRFSGFLNEPIVTYPFQDFFETRFRHATWDERMDILSEQEAWLDSIYDERLEKLILLLKHYGIERDDPKRWQRLAFRMALDFVPGMKVEYTLPRRRGRPKKWKGEAGNKFYQSVQAIAKERGRGVRDAIRTLLKRLVSGGNLRQVDKRDSFDFGDDVKILSDALSAYKQATPAFIRTLEARYHELARNEQKQQSNRRRINQRNTKKAR